MTKESVIEIHSPHHRTIINSNTRPAASIELASPIQATDRAAQANNNVCNIIMVGDDNVVVVVAFVVVDAVVVVGNIKSTC